MPDKKKYTAKQATEMVLKKAEELLKKSELMKAGDALSSIAGDRIKRSVGYKERGDKVGHTIAVEGAKDSHKERLQEIKDAPKPNLPKSEVMDKVEGQNEEWGTAPKTKGHFKLAKFLGYMESKRKSKKSL